MLQDLVFFCGSSFRHSKMYETRVPSDRDLRCAEHKSQEATKLEHSDGVKSGEAPPPSDSHHEDYEPFLVGESRSKPGKMWLESWVGVDRT